MLAAILNLFSRKSYEIYHRSYELTILGVRNESTVPDRFDDEIHVLFRNSSKTWVHYIFPATTDPGTYWLQKPLSPQGTAILKEGQYKNAYQIGLHRGKYYALVQARPVTVLRDYDRNAVLDFKNGREDTGLFGINIHHASESGTARTIDQYSAGCQVFANISDFNLFMKLCEVHKNLYGNSFTYTLIDKRAIKRQKRKQIAQGLAIGAAGLSLSLITYKISNL
jgi:hypothetical protein